MEDEQREQAPGAGLDSLRRENLTLRQLVSELGASSDKFLAVATHDLRTPLAGMRLLVDMLSQPGRVAPESVRLLDGLRRNLATIEALVADVLNAARLSQPGDTLNLTEFEFNALVGDVLAGLFPLAMKKNVTLDAKLDETAGVILADRARVGQMLTNLVGNALKFSPPGAAVTVSTAGDSEFAEATVTDTGPGLQPGDKDKLFKPFVRGSAPATGGEPSTGLGLYITKKIAEAHGGLVGADGAPGRGSTFFFRLPRRCAGRPRSSGA